jgi:hypothetical protein
MKRLPAKGMAVDMLNEHSFFPYKPVTAKLKRVWENLMARKDIYYEHQTQSDSPAEVK